MQGKWGETRPDLIITGFGAFPGMPDNPSSRLVKRLAVDQSFVRRGLKVETKLLPVSYSAAREAIASFALQAPRVLLMFGVAGKARKIRLEVMGINRASPIHRDARGMLPHPVLQPSKAGRLHAKGAELAVEALRICNPRIIRSRNAGRYLCNALLFHALDQCPAGTLVLFVHIPKLRLPQARLGDPRPNLAMLTKIGRDIAFQLVRAQRFRR